jgi:hypothetical protein
MPRNPAQSRWSFTSAIQKLRFGKRSLVPVCRDGIGRRRAGTRLLLEELESRVTPDVSIGGHAQWLDENGNPHPVPLAPVQIMADTLAGPTQVGHATTSTGGDFESSVPYDASYLDVFAVVSSSSPFANVHWVPATGSTDGATQTISSPVLDWSTVNDNTSVALQPATTGTDQTLQHAFSINSALVLSGMYFETVLMHAPLAPLPQIPVYFDHVERRDSDGVAGTQYTGSEIDVESADGFNWDPVDHEYGHYVAGTFGFDDSGGAPHTGGHEDLKLAWSEGYATYFAIAGQMALRGQPYAANVPRVGDTYYDDPGQDIHDDLSTPDPANDVGEDNEDSISRALFQLSQDGTVNDATIFEDVRNAQAVTMGEAWDAIAGPLSNEDRVQVATIFAGENICPQLDGPDDGAKLNAANPPTFSWITMASPYGVNDNQLEFFTTDMQTSLGTIDVPNPPDPNVTVTALANGRARYSFTLDADAAKQFGDIVSGHSSVKWVVEGQDSDRSETTPGSVSTSTLDRYWSDARTIGDISIIFVIDITGSMSDEIDGVKQGLQDYIDEIQNTLGPNDTPPTIELITFRDAPERVLTTDNLDAMRAAVDELSAEGGGDCPEPSADAVALAGEDIGPGGTIYGVTDASSDPGTDLAGTIDDLVNEGVTVDFSVDGDCSDDVEPSAVPVLSMPHPASPFNATFTDCNGPYTEAPRSTPVTVGTIRPFDDSGNPANATPISLNGAGATGTDSGTGYYYVSTLSAGTPVYLQVLTSQYTTVTVYESDASTEVTSQYVNGAATLTFTPSTAGQYYFKLQASSSVSANFAVRLIDATQLPFAANGDTPATATRITADGPAVYGNVGGYVQTPDGSGAVEQRDYFVAHLTGGTSYTTLLNSTGYADITVYGSNGTSYVASGYGSGHDSQTWAMTFTPSTTGDYHFEITPNYSQGTVPYAFRVTDKPGLDGNSVVLYSTITAQTGGTFLYDPAVKNGDPTDTAAFAASVFNVLRSTIEPTVLTATPNLLPQGTTLDVTLTGKDTDWQAGVTSVAFAGTGIVVDSVDVHSATSLTVQITVAADAPLTFSDVTVYSNLGAVVQTAVGSSVVRVTTPITTPTLLEAQPTTLEQGSAGTVVLRGIDTQWSASSTVDLGPGVTVTGVAAPSATELDASVTVDASAAIGFRVATVITPGQGTQSLDQAIFIGSAPSSNIPVVASIAPSSGSVGQTLDIAITGLNTHFVNGTTAAAVGAGITVNSVTVTDATHADANITITSNQSAGFHDVVLTTGTEIAVMHNGFYLTPPAAPSLPAVTEGATTAPGAALTSLIGSHLSDADPNAKQGIAVVGTTGHGLWQYSTDGKNWKTIGPVSVSSALLLPIGDSVRYLPAPYENGQFALRYNAWDQTTGQAGKQVKITAVGGGTSFSAQTGEIVAPVTQANEAPTWAQTTFALPEAAPGSTPSGLTLTSVVGPGFVDGDAGTQVGVAVVGVSGTSDGQWQYSADGTSWTTISSASASSALLLPGTDQVRYLPGAGATAKTQAVLSLRAWDGSTGIPGQTTDLSATGSVGGNTAFSVAIATLAAPINHAPVLGTTPPTLPSMNEDVSASPAITVSTLLTGVGYSDADAKALSGVALVGATGPGQWKYSLDGSHWFAVPAVDQASALLLTSKNKLRFEPGLHQSGTATLTYLAWDETSGRPGQLFDIATTGGGSAFSSNQLTAQLVVNHVNHSPTWTTTTLTLTATGNPAGYLVVPAQAANPPGMRLSNVLGSLFQDVENDPLGIAIVDLGGAIIGLGRGGGPGLWQYSTDDSSWTVIGNASASAAFLLPGTDYVRFLPRAGFAGAVTASFSAYAWDGTTGSAGATVDLSGAKAVGGSTAFSATKLTASGIVNTVHVPPTWTAATASLTPILPGTTNPAGDKLSTALGSLYSSPGGGTVGIAITALGGTASGSWQLSTDGTTWTKIGTVSPSKALLLPGSDYIRFVPNKAFHGTVTLTANAWDGSTGISGGTADLTTGKTGGITAFSAKSMAVSLAVNTAPVLTAIREPAMPSVNVNAKYSSAVPVSTLLKNVGYSDADPGAKTGVAITYVYAPSGSWQYSLDGSHWTVFTYTYPQVLLLPSSATIRYAPTQHVTGYAEIGYRAWDQTAGTPGQLVSVNTGGAWSCSTGTNYAVMNITTGSTTGGSSGPSWTTKSFAIPGVLPSPAAPASLNVQTVFGKVFQDTSGATVGIAVTGLTGTANGTWQYSTDGTTWLAFKTVSPSAARLLSGGAMIRFVPKAGFRGSVGLTVYAWDGSVGTDGGTAHATGAAFSKTSMTVTLLVNSAPAIKS